MPHDSPETSFLAPKVTTFFYDVCLMWLHVAVNVCPRVYLKNHMSKLHEICCTRCNYVHRNKVRMSGF